MANRGETHIDCTHNKLNGVIVIPNVAIDANGHYKMIAFPVMSGETAQGVKEALMSTKSGFRDTRRKLMASDKCDKIFKALQVTDTKLIDYAMKVWYYFPSLFFVRCVCFFVCVLIAVLLLHRGML